MSRSDPRLPKGPPDPEETDAAVSPAHGALPAATTVGSVDLTVSDLARSWDYYREVIGLEIVQRAERRLSLGAGERELLVLVEESGARPVPGSTGLYHFALLVPRRQDLARWLAHAARDRVILDGLSDHFVSEALYLTDPDGHGIEIYWDRPREIWEGQVAKRLTTIPLDVDDLLASLGPSSGRWLDESAAPFDGLPAGTVMGHVHLRVADISTTLDFYRDAFGFGLMAQLGRHAAFFAAGGYHHHLGTNTWESAGGKPAPAGSATLRHATIVLPDDAERERVIRRLRGGGSRWRTKTGARWCAILRGTRCASRPRSRLPRPEKPAPSQWAMPLATAARPRRISRSRGRPSRKTSPKTEKIRSSASMVACRLTVRSSMRSAWSSAMPAGTPRAIMACVIAATRSRATSP